MIPITELPKISIITTAYTTDRLVPRLIGLGLPVYGYRLPADYFIDIGTPEKYNQANEDIRANKLRISRIPSRRNKHDEHRS